MNKCLHITALLLGFGLTLPAFAVPATAAKPESPKSVVVGALSPATPPAAPLATKPAKTPVYADQPLPAAKQQATEAEPLPSPLTPGERVVVGLDPKEDFIILGKDEPEPVAPEPSAPEPEKSMLPLVDALGLGHTEPPPMKAPVSVSNGIVPPGPVLTPIVMVAGPNIGAKPVLPKPPAKKAQATTNLKKAVTVALKPLTSAPLVVKPEIKTVVKPIIVAEKKSKPAVQAKPLKANIVKQTQTPAKVKPARQSPVNHGPVNPNPVKQRVVVVKPTKKLAVVKPKQTIPTLSHNPVKQAAIKVTHPIKQALVIKKTLKTKTPEKVAFKPVIKAFVPLHHATAKPVVAHKPVIKKLAAKAFVFKPVIKPYRRA